MPVASVNVLVATTFLVCIMQLSLAKEVELPIDESEQITSLSSASADSAATFRKMEAEALPPAWWNVTSKWWVKNRSGFKKGFFTGLCVAWVVGGGGLVLAVISGLVSFVQHFSWHAKVTKGPMLPVHRLGCGFP